MKYSQEEISAFLDGFLEHCVNFAAHEAVHATHMSDVHTLTRLGYQDEAKFFHEVAIGLGSKQIDLIAEFKVIRQRTALILAAAGKDKRFNIGRYVFWSCLGKANSDYMEGQPVAHFLVAQHTQPVPGVDVSKAVDKLVSAIVGEKK